MEMQGAIQTGQMYQNQQTHLSNQSLMAKLWNLYLYYVGVIKEFMQCVKGFATGTDTSEIFQNV